MSPSHGVSTRQRGRVGNRAAPASPAAAPTSLPPVKIAGVEAFAISIPLPHPVADAVRRITHRDHLVVRIRTEDGVEGVGFTLGYDGSSAMVSLVDSVYRPILLRADPLATEALWAEMYRQSIQAGRRGAALRTMSAIDIALWDIRGKYARLPVMSLLGIYNTRLECYATGGYYREGRTDDELVEEMTSYVAQGFRAIKLKVGGADVGSDVARFGRVRRAVGDEVEILLDANGAWPDAPAAIRAMRRLGEFRPYWIEEPVRADNLSAMARIAEALEVPVATGELESTRWGFAELVERKAADILQPDATVVGGVTEWLKVAHLAAALDIPIAPHYNWDVHTQLLATVPNGLFVEYFAPASPQGTGHSQVKMFDEVLENPIHPVTGFIAPRTDPGFGLVFNEKKLKQYRVG